MEILILMLGCVYIPFNPMCAKLLCAEFRKASSLSQRPPHPITTSCVTLTSEVSTFTWAACGFQRKAHASWCFRDAFWLRFNQPNIWRLPTKLLVKWGYNGDRSLSFEQSIGGVWSRKSLATPGKNAWGILRHLEAWMCLPAPSNNNWFLVAGCTSQLLLLQWPTKMMRFDEWH